jgi:SAM-dependent methyltransferase
MSRRSAVKLRRLGPAYQLIPRPIYQLLRNAAHDLASIPRRLKGDLPGPLPWMVLHNVGSPHFYESGRAIVRRIVTQLELSPSAAVFDVGCGSGRTAWPLADHLDADGRYIGFDVSPAALAFARRLLAGRRPDFVFEHADLYSGEYNPNGRIQARDYVFPCPDGWADAALAVSLFTHLAAEDARRFFAEIGRILRPEGRAYVTAFLVDAAAEARLADGRATYQLLRGPAPLWVGDPRTPEMATGYDEPAFMAMIDAAGLALARPVERGSWSGAEGASDFQDTLILVRKRPGG